MLTVLLATTIGFIAGIALVVWQWATVSKLKKLVDELQKSQANMLAGPLSFATINEGVNKVPAEDRILAAIEALAERLAPTPKPADPVEMLVRRIHAIEQDVIAASQATANNTRAIEHHSDRLDAQGSEHSRLSRMIQDMERDAGGDFQRIDEVQANHADAIKRFDRNIGQLAHAIDALNKRTAPKAAPEAAKEVA